MFYLLSLISYLLLFTLLTWRYFHLDLVLLFLLLPTYLIRFNLGPLPTTLLEVMIWIITIIWLIKYSSSIILNLKSLILNYKTLFIATALFLLAATISVFTSSNLRVALGEWKAFYFEPILIFIILITTLKNNFGEQQKISDFRFQNAKYQSTICNLQSTIIYALILSGLITSILAIYQHFTGFLVPYSFWQNQNTFRVTAWYGFPNAVGLFLAPIIPLAIYLLKENYDLLKKRNWKLETGNYWPIITLISNFLFLISAPLAIIFAQSTGALVGLAAGLGFLLLLYKKTRWPTIIIGAVCLSSLLSFSSLSGLRQELFLQDRSGQIRIGIWQETIKFLEDHPLAGAGLASYEQKIAPYHKQVNGENIEIFHHPHNIFLTMWINLGLLGLIAFIWILIVFFRIGLSHITYHISHNSSTIKPFSNLTIFILSSMIIILVMGLVDSPYIKNDLAILFWLLPALLIINKQSQSV